MTLAPPAHNARLVTIFGGSGFVGRHLARALAKRGWRIRAAVRRPDLAFHLQPLGGVGQVTAVQANLRYPQSVAAALRGADAAVNLVGILAPRGRQTFEAVQDFGTRAIARAAREAGIANVVQMSAIGADAQSDSLYARSKASGEAAMLEANASAIIARASIIFGPEDQFFNRFAALARALPALPLIGAQTKFQPVYVGDVAAALADMLDGKAKPGATYELGGPQVQTFRALVEYVLAVTQRKRLLVPLPFAAGHAMAFGTEIADRLSFGLMPSQIVTTRDQVKLLATDNVVSETAKAQGRTLEGLGLTPTSYEAIVPAYLMRYRRTGQFEVGRA